MLFAKILFRGPGSVAATALFTVVACGDGYIDGTPLDAGARDGLDSSARAKGSEDRGCTTTPARPMDPASLPACCNGAGKAHCLDASALTAGLSSQLDKCTGAGYCVPDVFIRNPAFKPPTCKSLSGAAGVCMSVCVPQVAQYKDVLPKDTCGDDERCAPCVNPLDSKRSGACDVGTSSPAPACGGASPDAASPAGGDTSAGDGGPGGLAACCTMGTVELGKCVPSTLVPADQQSYVARDRCTDAALCVPSEMIPLATFKPVACTSPSPLPVGPAIVGVCLSKCLTFVGVQAAVVRQGTCDAAHLCAPCKDPLGQPTGAPGCK